MNISESSIKTYTAALNSLARDMGYQVLPEGYSWLKNAGKVYEIIKNSYPSYNTRNNKLFAIKYLLDIHDAPVSLLLKYEDYISEVKEAIEEQRADNKKSQKEKDNWLTKEQLQEILKDLEVKTKRGAKTMTDYRNVMRYLILKIHIETPLRNDLADAKIFMDPDEDDIKDTDYNYIVLDSKAKTARFIGNVYKTKASHGQIKFNWSKDIYDELAHYYHDIVDKSVDNYFIVNQNGDKMTPNNYTKFIKSIFTDYDKNISTSMIRHIIISDLYDLNETTEAKKKELAYKMGHTTHTAATIYAKI
jgi:hypothetical protein